MSGFEKVESDAFGDEPGGAGEKDVVGHWTDFLC
jgi:hypothetical protein